MFQVAKKLKEAEYSEIRAILISAKHDLAEVQKQIQTDYRNMALLEKETQMLDAYTKLSKD